MALDLESHKSSISRVSPDPKKGVLHNSLKKVMRNNQFESPEKAKPIPATQAAGSAIM